MNVKESAKSLGIPTQTLYARINRQVGVGKEFVKINGRWVIDGRILNSYKSKKCN